MVSVEFITASGESQMLEIASGVSLMEGAVKGGIEGIDADCGGALACATCQVRVSPSWIDRLTPPGTDERAMLEFAWEADETSRLSCQLILTEDLEGLVVTIPERQS